METHKLFFSHFCFFLFSLLIGYQGVYGSSHHHHHHHHRHHNLYGFRPAKLFVFGDSYADTGNNKKSDGNSWKVPYGITFPGKPAGRFSDGRVLTDFIAKFFGFKSPIAYRWRNMGGKRLRNGMNFAYGGTGVFDTLVSYPNMTTQIGFLQKLVNDSVYTKEDLQSSLTHVSVAGNDYSAYLAKGGNTGQGLQTFIMQVVSQIVIDLKRIHSMGVRKITVTALQPLGCLPRNTVTTSFQQCNATLNTAVSFHNLLLQQAVAKLNNETKDSSFIILDLYTSFTSAIKNQTVYPESLKFETPILKPCCMGMSNEYSCGSVDDKGVKMYAVCDNPDSAFFWDTVHPTQAGWRAVFPSLKATLQQI
ncbi:GDSL esterase/lipase At5g03610 isoform X2 [Cornus florida]|uniref:GDSL esterase/lipase At5g03610 isoform X2 n=1 Tax=Cornus florida TaxID=4283 RepID=UPI0028A0DC5E|nr:GDSL esterase/lipase At5g03610 isoform X2 [Cornus florida]